jgi:hypothetical protein
MNAIDEMQLPAPSGGMEYHGVQVYEIKGPASHQDLIIAFGSVPLATWLEIVNEYHEDYGMPAPWDPEDSDKVVACVGRLHYYRVHFDPAAQPGNGTVGDDVRIDWNTNGVVPITLWMIQWPEAPEDAAAAEEASTITEQEAVRE